MKSDVMRPTVEILFDLPRPLLLCLCGLGLNARQPVGKVTLYSVREREPCKLLARRRELARLGLSYQLLLAGQGFTPILSALPVLVADGLRPLAKL